jgi:hypothetical protein
MSKAVAVIESSLDGRTPNIAPFYSSTIYAIRRATVAGATNTYTIAGVKTGDLVFAAIDTVGSTPRTIVSAKATAADTVAIVFSGDPSTDHVISLEICRILA